jgi:hypothetical protein
VVISDWLLELATAVSLDPTVAVPIMAGSESKSAPASTALLEAAQRELVPTELVVRTSAVTNFPLWAVVVTKVVRLAAPAIGSQSSGFAETAAETALTHSYQ